MSIIGLDPQITGVLDDGSPEGVVKTATIRGDLVMVPFRINRTGAANDGQNWYAEMSGTATVSVVTNATYNADRTATDVRLLVPASTALDNAARLHMTFYGTVFGLRWRRNKDAADFVVLIDGTPYPVTGADRWYVENGLDAYQNNDCLYVIARDLPDIEHHATIMVVSDPVAARQIDLHGMLLERRAGYADPRPIDYAAPPVAVPTTHTAIGRTNLPGVRKIVYTNTTATPVAVEVNGLGAVPCWRKTIPATDTAELDFGTMVTLVGTWTHKAATASAVYATVIGGI